MECWWLAVASVSQSQCVASSCLDTCSEADLDRQLHVHMYAVTLLQTKTLTPVPTVCVRLPSSSLALYLKATALPSSSTP